MIPSDPKDEAQLLVKAREAVFWMWQHNIRLVTEECHLAAMRRLHAERYRVEEKGNDNRSDR